MVVTDAGNTGTGASTVNANFTSQDLRVALTSPAWRGRSPHGIVGFVRCAEPGTLALLGLGVPAFMFAAAVALKRLPKRVGFEESPRRGYRSGRSGAEIAKHADDGWSSSACYQQHRAQYKSAEPRSRIRLQPLREINRSQHPEAGSGTG